MLLRALIPKWLNEGLMKPRRGFALVEGKEKMGVGKSDFPLDKGRRLLRVDAALDGLRALNHSIHSWLELAERLVERPVDGSGAFDPVLRDGICRRRSIKTNGLLRLASAG